MRYTIEAALALRCRRRDRGRGRQVRSGSPHAGRGHVVLNNDERRVGLLGGRRRQRRRRSGGRSGWRGQLVNLAATAAPHCARP